MKLIIDIPDEEYKTLSKMSEKEKVNELSYYEKVIANGIPYKAKGKWINTSPYDIKGECSLCCYLSNKCYNFCPNCGADMR